MRGTAGSSIGGDVGTELGAGLKPIPDCGWTCVDEPAESLPHVGRGHLSVEEGVRGLGEPECADAADGRMEASMFVAAERELELAWVCGRMTCFEQTVCPQWSVIGASRSVPNGQRGHRSNGNIFPGMSSWASSISASAESVPREVREGWVMTAEVEGVRESVIATG